MLDGIATGTVRSATPAKEVCAEWLRQPSPEGHGSLSDKTAAWRSRTIVLIAGGRIAGTKPWQGGAAPAFTPGRAAGDVPQQRRAMSVKPSAPFAVSQAQPFRTARPTLRSAASLPSSRGSSAASHCSTASANPYVAHPGNRATTLHCGTTHVPRQWSRSPAGRLHPTNREGRRVSHEYLSTPEACKGRDAPSSALAVHTAPGQATHFPAPRTGRGAALGLRHEAPAGYSPSPNPNGTRVCASGP